MASNFTDPDVIAEFVGTLAAGLIGAFAVWLTARRSDNILKEQLKQNEKQHQVQGLLEVFRIQNARYNRT